MMLHVFLRQLAMLLHLLFEFRRDCADFLFFLIVAGRFGLRLVGNLGIGLLQRCGLRGIDGGLHALRLVIGPLVGGFGLRQQRFILLH